MPDETAASQPHRRTLRIWLGCTAVALGLLVAAAIGIMQVIHRDPCDSVLPYAADMGLRLSADDEVVSCTAYPSFPDSSAKVVVRTASPATRQALLERSGVSEELDRSLISINDGPFHERVRRPNLTRSEQVYVATENGSHVLKISYEKSIESGLLLTVWAMDM